jgi:hypothetical protein
MRLSDAHIRPGIDRFSNSTYHDVRATGIGLVWHLRGLGRWLEAHVIGEMAVRDQSHVTAESSDERLRVTLVRERFTVRSCDVGRVTAIHGRASDVVD